MHVVVDRYCSNRTLSLFWLIFPLFSPRFTQVPPHTVHSESSTEKKHGIVRIRQVWKRTTVDGLRFEWSTSIDRYVCTARHIRHVIHAFVSWQSTCQSKQRKEHVTSWWWFAFLEFLYVCFRFRLFILEQDRDYSTLATHIHILRTSIISFLGGASDIREIANRLWDEADEQELGELGAIFLRSCPSLGSLINHWDMSGWP